MELTNQIILIGGLLFLLSILASVISSRIGAPLLLVFLVIGMLVGEEGPGGVRFDDFQSAHLIGSMALAVILFDGGLRTRVETFRVGLRPAVTLATLGVVITVLATGFFVSWAFGLPLLVGLLIGAIIGSTDAAAVFSLLHSHGLELKQRTSATLEIESGSNDPMAIFLTIALVEIIMGQHASIGAGLLVEFVTQIGVGALAGLGGGLALALLINRIGLTPGLYPLLALAGGLLLFGATSVANGSGFLAVYLAGVILGNRRLQSAQNIRRFHDGMAWLSQIVMFLMLGLLITPSNLIAIAPQALLIAAMLILVARPLAVVICLLPFRFPWRDQAFISWVGLRGAVPILLGLFPLMAGVDNAFLYFNVAFFVVLISLVVQGWTIAPVARLLQLDVPPRSRVVHRMELDLPGQVEYELVGYTLESDSPALYKMVNRLQLPDSVRLLAIIRDGNPVAEPGTEILQDSDYLYLLTPPERLPELDRVLVADHGPARLEETRFFGEFVLNGDVPLAALANTYELDIPERGDEDESLSDYLQRLFKNRAVVGDRVKVNHMEFVVRAMEGQRITQVGMKLARQHNKDN
ncbi:cell volume regulation protein A [Natronocella acetinitrilica]|uniref:Cell volume regulation protein A n=1 Tax=Natronocella acetinitrilica TaxID=414046 RepID=A0AAE3KAV9_9GAMM|nr:potassium/proton antiporter [Natronocella acetinitrilica]MCP1674059.1 cell volume regulation protein A [Natronocella acetinitrilica]